MEVCTWWALEVETAERLRAELVWEGKVYISKASARGQESVAVVWRGLWRQTPQEGTPALPQRGWASDQRATSLILSVPLFPHLQNGSNNNNIYLNVMQIK